MTAIDQHDDDDVMASINIIPFVDIVLVLLIIFMVTSTAIVKGALKVDLPTAASAGSTVDATLNIVFTTDNLVFVDGDQVARESLPGVIKARVALAPGTQAVISADKMVAYGEVVTLIDLIKQNGVETFALNFERSAQES